MLRPKSLKSSFQKPNSDTNQDCEDGSYILSQKDVNFSSSMVNKIGQGASASVYRGTYKNQPVAIKQFAIDNPNLPRSKNLLQKEASELVQLEHVNVIKCFGVCYEISSLILELAAKQVLVEGESYVVHSLRQLIETVEMSIELQHEALFQVSRGLQYLHGQRIAHGDLKSANVLLTGDEGDFIFKLGDFGQAHAALTSKLGTSMSVVNGSSSRRGTISFEAPEVFLNGTKTTASDIYAFAMIVYEISH